MPMTIVNNVIHIARLLFHRRKRFARGSPAKETRETLSGSTNGSGAKPDRGSQVGQQYAQIEFPELQINPA